MRFLISWTGEKNLQESLSFSEEFTRGPTVTINGRRFFLQNANCRDAKLIKKVTSLQTILFDNIGQFVEDLRAETALKNKKIEIQKERGENQFLDRILPQIESAKTENCKLQTTNPYFQSNSVEEGEKHPLYRALISKNHETLKQLCSNPYLLLINEKFFMKEMQYAVTPLEYAILTNDLEAYHILLASPAFNKETALPLDALKKLGPDKASPYIEAYVCSKPNLIDTSFCREGYEEMKSAGFSLEAITLLNDYYQTNAHQIHDETTPTIVFGMICMMQQEAGSEEFKQWQQRTLELFRSGFTNLDALIEKDSIIERICHFVFIIETTELTPFFPNLETKRPILHAIVSKILKTGRYTLVDSLYALLKDLPRSLFEAVPKAKIDAYHNSKTQEEWALNTRKNLITLLGKQNHVTQRLASNLQGRKWNRQVELVGGNQQKNFTRFVRKLFEASKALSGKENLVLRQYIEQERLERHYQVIEGNPSKTLATTETNQSILKEMLKRINAFAYTTYLKFGTEKHTSALLFHKNYYITCNRLVVLNEAGKVVEGASIKIYSFNKFLSEWELRMLLRGVDDSATYLKILNGKNALLHEIPLKPQKYLNCSWASDLEPALLVLAQLERNPNVLLKEGKFDEEVKTKMQNFAHFAKYIAIKDYVETHRTALSTSVGHPDNALTGKALLYALFKCATKNPAPDPYYIKALDELVYSGLAISLETASMEEYSPVEREKMKEFLEERYALSGFRIFFASDQKSDAEAFLFYLTDTTPKSGIWPRSLIS